MAQRKLCYIVRKKKSDYNAGNNSKMITYDNNECNQLFVRHGLFSHFTAKKYIT